MTLVVIADILDQQGVQLAQIQVDSNLGAQLVPAEAPTAETQNALAVLQNAFTAGQARLRLADQHVWVTAPSSSDKEERRRLMDIVAALSGGPYRLQYKQEGLRHAVKQAATALGA